MRSFLFAGLRNGLSPVRDGLRESCSSLSHIYREQSVALFELEPTMRWHPFEIKEEAQQYVPITGRTALNTFL